MPPHLELPEARPRGVPAAARRRGAIPRRSAHRLVLGAPFGLASLLACRGAAQRPASGDVPDGGAPDRPTVLIVDDAPAVLEVLACFMEHGGWRTIPIARPEDALARFEREPRLALVTSGIRMPAASNGLAFIRAVRRHRPALPLAVIAAFPADLAPLSGTPDWPFLVHAKPVRLKQILEMLRLAAEATAAPGSRRR